MISEKSEGGAAPGAMPAPFGGVLREGFMITVTEGKNCEVCGKNEAVVVCNGCGRALCGECRVFDIWASGCGHGLTRVFCRKCDADPKINFWKASE